MASDDNQNIYRRPEELLQNLIRFDTINPPGNEAECIFYINELLTGAGYKTKLVYKDSNRPNLIAPASREKILQHHYYFTGMWMWLLHPARNGHIRLSRER